MLRSDIGRVAVGGGERHSRALMHGTGREAGCTQAQHRGTLISSGYRRRDMAIMSSHCWLRSRVGGAGRAARGKVVRHIHERRMKK